MFKADNYLKVIPDIDSAIVLKLIHYRYQLDKYFIIHAAMESTSETASAVSFSLRFISCMSQRPMDVPRSGRYCTNVSFIDWIVGPIFTSTML